MKKFIIILALCAGLLPLQAIALENLSVQEDVNLTSPYDRLYQNQPVLNFRYDENEDPQEVYDYQQYIQSPYPLLRISMILKNKNITVKPGYYLITPRSKDGYDFVLFKQYGKIVHIMPVYEKIKINPALIYPKPPKKKTPLWKLPFVGIKKLFSPLFKKVKKPPAPKRFMVKTEMPDGGKYYSIWIYEEDMLYKMIFLPIK